MILPIRQRHVRSGTDGSNSVPSTGESRKNFYRQRLEARGVYEAILPNSPRASGAPVKVATDQRPIMYNMYKRIDPLISASRGTLAGDLLWLAAIGFIVAIVTGLIG